MSTVRTQAYFEALGSADHTFTEALARDMIASVSWRVSGDADGAGAVAGYVDTSGNWANATAKLWSWRNNGTEKAWLDATGRLAIAAGSNALPALYYKADASGGIVFDNSAVCLIANGGRSVTIRGGQAIGTLTFGWGWGDPDGMSIETQYRRYGDGKVYLSGATPMFALGGTTSSYPAWKRRNAQMECRLADNSGASSIVFDVDGASTKFSTVHGGGFDLYNTSYQKAWQHESRWMLLSAGLLYGWSATANIDDTGGPDAALQRVSAGVVAVCSGTFGTYRDLQLRKLLDTNGVQVVTTQGAAVADASVTLVDVIAQFNAWLARARAHGLIAT